MTRKKITVLAVVVLAVVATAVGVIKLALPGGSTAMPDHITVSQALYDAVGQEVKVGGEIIPGSISWDSASRSLRFALAGEGESMTVVYQGVAPDDFRPGARLVVEGRYDPSGTFTATALTTTGSPLCRACHG